jgi:small-conductance mechanosensitive channel
MRLRWGRLRHDLATGFAVVQRGSATAMNRSLEEVELLRLKFRLDAVEAEIKERYHSAGERAFHLIERETGALLKEKELMRQFEKIDELVQEENRIRFEMQQVRD